MTQLIPRKVLFSNPDHSDVKLSPDGRYISFMGVTDGVRNLFLAPADKPTEARALTHDRGRGIPTALWTPNGRYILYTQDEKGNENHRLWAIEVESGTAKCLTPVEKIAAAPLATSKRRPDEVLVLLNERDARLHDVYRINIETGERTMICQNPGNLFGFVADHDLRVAFAHAYQPDGSLSIIRHTEDGGWKEWQRLGPEDSLSIKNLGLDATDQEVYFLDTRGREYTALVAYNVESGAERVLYADPNTDVTSMLFKPNTSELQAVATARIRKQWKAIGTEIEKDLSFLASAIDGEVEVVGRSNDDQRWVVMGRFDKSPERYFVYQRDEQTLTELFPSHGELSRYEMSSLQPVVIKARDGLSLVSYYMLPPGTADESGKMPRTPLPMILMVHGGPWGRISFGFDPSMQWMANRGYAVLAVNFRGSTGFGKSFLNAGDREWGRTMQNDLTDAVNWAINAKLADPQRICITGSSYGGYATLMGLATTPELYACGVAMAAPTNLVSVLANQPPYYSPYKSLFQKRLGDISTEEGKQALLEVSPISLIGNFCKPLLIAHGVNDVRVKRDEADSLVKAMEEKGKPVTHVIYTDEGHAVVRPENGRSFIALTEVFLSRYLGGACEPIGEDLKGANLQVLTGAVDVQMEKSASA